MKKGSAATAVMSLVMAGIGAAFNSIEGNDFGEGLLKVLIMIFALGGSLMGLFAVVRGNVTAKLLGVIGVALNIWLFVSILG